MTNSQLFGVSNKGRIFALQTDQSVWKELPYLGIDFKRVSAHDNVAWALGGDHQVYVYVYGTSVPIRVCEEAYENQRWNPVESFTSNLLPTDRPSYSSEDGLTDRNLDNIRLPSLAWTWEGPWHLLDTFEGKALEKECWTYAMDFPRSFYATKKWNSCVRRRKWIRYRTYVALDTWSAVSPIHKDPTEEPFIDIVIGGGEVQGMDSDELMVWGITALGKVMVREGINAISPEGIGWKHIPTPTNHDITSMSISRSGRVWAVTWDGKALIRSGICRDYPEGIDWCTVNSPEGDKINQIAVGNSVVWVICRDSSLWFRRNLGPHHSDVGSSWLNMVGCLSVISIGPNDQVWGITSDDHSLVVRTGVTPMELTGKTWKAINLSLLHFDADVPHAADSINSFDEASSSESVDKQFYERLHPEVDEVSLQTDLKDCSEDLSSKLSLEDNITTSSDSSRPTVPQEQRSYSDDGNNEQINDKNEVAENPSLDDVKVRNFEEVPDSLTSSVMSDSETNFIGQDYSIEETLPKECSPATEDSKLPLPSSVRKRLSSTSSSVASDVLLAKDRSSIAQEETPYYELTLPEENIWLWVSGGGCWFQPHNMPKWFLSDFSIPSENEPWRKSILTKLLDRKKKEIIDFNNYPEAIETSSWTVNGQCRLLTNGRWVPATLELCMVGSKGRKVQEASFTIVYSSGVKRKTLVPCCSIVLCTLTVDLPAKAVISVYTSSEPLNPILLLFSAEKDAEEWINHINFACIKYRGLDRQISPYTIWGITSQGLMYVHDFSSSEQEMKVETDAAHRTIHYNEQTTSSILRFDLEKRFRPGSFVTIVGTISEDAKRFYINLAVDTSLSNLALHFNPRFDQKALVMNSRENNLWSTEDRDSIKSLSRGKDFEITILSDDRDMKISIDGKLRHRFNHRLMPGDIEQLQVEGDVLVKSITYNHGAGERLFQEYFWRGIGGHLKQVESGAGGIVWGVSYDFHVYTFTGGTGGGIYKNCSNDSAINLMSDVRYFYIWENQRWNPVTGFTYKGLPTDRSTWSDVTGRLPKTKETTKLPSRHWQWISDWSVDHHAPEGVDKDGWQYATDFPMSYHAHRYVTDLVRRRRWYRKCRISTSGPWKQMEKVSLISISISPTAAHDGSIPVWGVSVSNEVVMREGVTPDCIEGTRWVLITSETKMKEVCAGIDGGVWAICCNGQAHFRIGVTKNNPKGYEWVNIDAPTVPLRQIGFGNESVFAVDRDGSLHYRVNVQPLFPEGTAWHRICGEVDRISVSADGSLWAILSSYPSPTHGSSSPPLAGVLVRRRDVSKKHPGGTSWDLCSGSGWSHVSIRMPISC